MMMMMNVMMMSKVCYESGTMMRKGPLLARDSNKNASSAMVWERGRDRGRERWGERRSERGRESGGSIRYAHWWVSH